MHVSCYKRSTFFMVNPQVIYSVFQMLLVARLSTLVVRDDTWHNPTWQRSQTENGKKRQMNTHFHLRGRSIQDKPKAGWLEDMKNYETHK